MMPQDKTTTPLPTTPCQEGDAKIQGRPTLPMLLLAVLFVALIGGGYFTLRDKLAPGRDDLGCMEESVPPDTDYPNDHRQWQQPLFALVLTGQMHGFTDKCGCSDPQYGGLPRRWNFVQSLKAKNWDVVGIDLGELPQLKGIGQQNLLKFELTIRSLTAMNYKVFGVGRDELLTPLGDALTQIWDKKTVYPRPIILNLADAAPGGLFNQQLNTRQYEIFHAGKVKVGVLNMVGPGLRDELKDKEKFLSNQEELPKALAAFADAGVTFGVILHHEYPQLDEKKFPKGGIDRWKEIDKEREKQAKLAAEFCNDARAKNPKIPPIQLMMTLTEDGEAWGVLKELDNLPTRVVEIGHKGKYVGLVGVYADRSGYRLQYQKVVMSSDWDSPKGKEKDNFVIQVYEKYNQVLAQQNMLARAVRAPHPNQVDPQSKGLATGFAGSKACMNCHREAYKAWLKTDHAKGTDTLEKLENPKGRHFDPECIKCHVTGFEHPAGFHDPIADLAKWIPGPNQAAQEVKVAHNTKLRGIGCESCHGPASEHVKIANLRQPTPAEILALNPYRVSAPERALEAIANKNPAQLQQFNALRDKRLGHLNNFCIKCHDSENDVHWNDRGVMQKWLKIIHRTDGGKAAPAPAANGGEPPPIVIEVIDEKKK